MLAIAENWCSERVEDRQAAHYGRLAKGPEGDLIHAKGKCSPVRPQHCAVPQLYRQRVVGDLTHKGVREDFLLLLLLLGLLLRVCFTLEPGRRNATGGISRGRWRRHAPPVLKAQRKEME